MTDDQKARLKSGIRRNDKDLYELLCSDEVKQIVKEFDGCFDFDRAEIERLIKP